MATQKFSNNMKDLAAIYKDSKVFQELIDNTLALQYNEVWWKSQFTKASLPTPLGANGSATFQAIEIIEASSPMLSPRAAWTPPKEDSTEGAEYYMDSLWDWGTSFSITAQEQAYYDRMLKTTNVPLIVLNKFINTLDKKLLGAHATVSHQCAQLLSNGNWISANQEGFKAKGICDKIPAEMRKTAGPKAWTDPTAPIYETIVKYVQEYRDKTKDERPLSLKMTKEEFENIQHNEWFKNNIGVMVILGGIYNPNPVVTIEKVNEYALQQGGWFPVIELIEEKQVLQDNGYTIKKDVKGWKQGMVVMSPIGSQGDIHYADVEELSYLVQGEGDRSMAYLEGGLFGFLNWVEVGRSPRWITELLATFAPALTLFRHTMYINSLVAD